MIRIFVLIHRYLGIAIGWLVALWCLSGFVMMYVQYPELDDDEYKSGLATLNFSGCCTLNGESRDELQGVERLTVEMLADRPVMRAWQGRNWQDVYDLSIGQRISEVDLQLATDVASGFAANVDISDSVSYLSLVERDQWTVSGVFDRFRPLYLFAADDEGGTQLYVSAVTPQVVQVTTAHERFWNWIGAIPHWLYPTVLRQNAARWSQVVIWTSLASIFLVLVGAYIGIRQLVRPKNSGKSPYAGITLWHHYAGLVFGVLTLTWLFSGLLSMNPWGLLEADGAGQERARLGANTISVVQIGSLIKALATANIPDGAVQLRSTSVNGEFALLADDGGTRTTRLDAATLEASPLPDTHWTGLARLLRPETEVLSAGWIDRGDAYYYSHHQAVRFPVWRIVYDDAQQTRYYFDPDSAELISKVDANRRWHRWLFLALHRGDFSAWIRFRPVWDIMLLPLLFGVSAGALTGAYLGIRRLVRQKL